jgi:hypothetical protein
MYSTPRAPLPAFIPLALKTVLPHAFRHERRRHGGQPDVAPLLLRVFHELMDDQPGEDTGGLYPMRAHPHMGAGERAVMLTRSLMHMLLAGFLVGSKNRNSL